MARTEDPKKTRLRAERELAQLRVDVLARGIGATLNGGYRNCVEDIDPLIDLINGEFVRAVQALKTAEDNYRPYWSRGGRPLRVSIIRPKKAKKVA